MAKKQQKPKKWDGERWGGYGVLIEPNRADAFLAHFSERDTQLPYRALFRRRSDAVAAKRGELAQFKTRIVRVSVVLSEL